MRFVDGAIWRASRTPEGIGTLAIELRADELTARAWGQGADWLLDSVPDLVGESDDWGGLDLAASPVLLALRRRFPGVRLCRTGLVMDSLVPACLEQRVTGNEAWTAWRGLVWAHGEAAADTAGGSAQPPPVDSVAEANFEEGPRLRVAADPAALRAVPSWDWHRFGVDLQRHKAIRAAATVAGRLEECVAMTVDGDFGGARSRLRLVPGVGEWTAAETALRALGDPDAVSVGDFHLKNLVGYVLAGSHRTDDATMLELLEPWRGQRARVIRLIELSGVTPPKCGPRFSPNDIRRI